MNYLDILRARGFSEDSFDRTTRALRDCGRATITHAAVCPPRGRKVERKCQNKRCGKTFTARAADVARGWAKFCSKSCKASEQEGRTHQNANYHGRQSQSYGTPTFSDAHLFDNIEHDCNKGA